MFFVLLELKRWETPRDMRLLFFLSKRAFATDKQNESRTCIDSLK